MVIDTSAIVAILRKEPGFEGYSKAIIRTDEAYLSAVNLLECHLGLAATPDVVGRLVEDAEIIIKDFTRTTAALAQAAFSQYGKGRHRAALNICDCAAYATAKECNLPLLFKGQDLALTDVVPITT